MKLKPVTLIITLMAITFIICSCTKKQVAVEKPPQAVMEFCGEIKSVTFYNKENLKLFGRYWIPLEGVKAVILLVHGTSMHSGTYNHVGRYLASSGYVVYGADLQGWGQSQGKGRKGYIRSYDHYIADLKLVMENLRNEYPQNKIFGMGESLGGIVPLYGQLKNELNFDGFILCAPGYRPNLKLLGIRAPEFVNWGLKKMVIMGGTILPKLPVIPSDLGIAMVVNDKEMETSLKKDPYVTHTFLPAIYAKSLLKASEFIDTRLSEIHQPTLLFHGEKDILIPVKSSETLLEKISSQDKELKVFKDTGHATLLEAPKYEILRDIREWLNKRS